MIKYFSLRAIPAVIFGMALSATLTTTASAQFGYTTGFEPAEGYSSPGGLSDYNGWVTNDPLLQVAPGNTPNSGAPEYYALQATTNEYIGQTDSIGALDPTFGSGLYEGAIGGRGAAVPHSPTIYLSQPFSVSAYNQFRFNTDFKIFNSTSNSPFNSSVNNDTFGWTLFSGNAIQLAITFTPAAGNLFDVRIDGGASTGVLNYNAAHQLEVYIAPNGDVIVKFNNVEFYNASSVITANSITSVAATQIIQDTAQDTRGAYIEAGNNQMLFDNYSAVPEPSTVGLAIIAGLGGAVVMFRRRNKTA